MLPVERWVIFYADGSQFCSEQGSWAEAPPFGVHAVVYYHAPEGVTLAQDQDVYGYLGVPLGCDVPVKMGLYTDGVSYWRVHDLVERAVRP